MVVLGGGAVSYERGTPVGHNSIDRSITSPMHRSQPFFFFFFLNLQPLKKWSTTNYAQFALDREPGSLHNLSDVCVRDVRSVTGKVKPSQEEYQLCLSLQGYLAHKKLLPPRTLQEA